MTRLVRISDRRPLAFIAIYVDSDLYDGWVCTRIATTESYGGIPEFSVVVAFKVI